MKVDAQVQCQDPRIQRASMAGIDDPVDLAKWKVSRCIKHINQMNFVVVRRLPCFRQSTWMEKSLGRVLDITESARCMEKVSQDFVFVQVSLPNVQVQISSKEPKYTLVDRLGIFGKKYPQCQIPALVS